MYPMTLMCLSPLSGATCASMPHVLVLLGLPPEPNPILESQEKQSPSLLPMIPILVLGRFCKSLSTWKPSRLQLCCKEPWEPSRLFHVSRPTEVGRNCPSAINECSDLALWSMVIKFVVSLPGIFMPRQIFENGLLQ